MLNSNITFFNFKIYMHLLQVQCKFLFLCSIKFPPLKLGSYPLSTDKHSVNNAASWSLTSSNHQNFRFFQQGAHKSVQNKSTKLLKDCFGMNVRAFIFCVTNLFKYFF